MDIKLNLNNKKFRSIGNSENGEVSGDTTFHYRQNGSVVWATYSGGDILFGTMSGFVEDRIFTFTYQHMNKNKAFMTGKCKSSIKEEKGKIRMYEEWQWTCGDNSTGTSIIEEIKE